MEITEIKIVPKEGPDKKLKAYATLMFDNCFVIRNVKVIKGNKGLFVAMPSRKIRESCPRCNYKNALRSKFCNQCGSSLPVREIKPVEGEARQSEHKDIAHPITLECREYIQKKVLEAYEAELKNTPQGSYVSGKTKPSSPVTPAEAPKANAEPPREEETKPEEEEGDIQL